MIIIICLDVFSPSISLSLRNVSGDQSVCFHSAGGCHKRHREDIGSDDRDFIKRAKGDFNHRVAFFRESGFAQMI